MNKLKHKNTVDHMPLTFGKYKGKTPYSLLDSNPSYLIWMYENITIPPCTKELYSIAQERKADDEFMNEITAEYHATNYGDRE